MEKGVLWKTCSSSWVNHWSHPITCSNKVTPGRIWVIGTWHAFYYVLPKLLITSKCKTTNKKVKFVNGFIHIFKINMIFCFVLQGTLQSRTTYNFLIDLVFIETFCLGFSMPLSPSFGLSLPLWRYTLIKVYLKYHFPFKPCLILHLLNTVSPTHKILPRVSFDTCCCSVTKLCLTLCNPMDVQHLQY